MYVFAQPTCREGCATILHNIATRSLTLYVFIAVRVPDDEDDSEVEFASSKKPKRKRRNADSVARAVKSQNVYKRKNPGERKCNQYTSGKPLNSPYFAPEDYQVGFMASCSYSRAPKVSLMSKLTAFVYKEVLSNFSLEYKLISLQGTASRKQLKFAS